MIIIEILRKQDWRLNPDDKLVNEIFRKLDKSGGHCPTNIPNRKGHDQCPCSDYLQNNNCHCKLYVKENQTDYEKSN